MKNTLVIFLASLFLYGCSYTTRLQTDMMAISKGIKYCIDKQGLKEIEETSIKHTKFICVTEEE